jgi:type I restriction enzyme, S subunit
MVVNLDELPLPDELPAIPDGWCYESLGDLVEERGVSYGIVQPGSETTDGVPIVRVNNIRNGRIDTTDMLKVEADIEAKFQRSRLRGGEVLLTLVGTLGEVAIVPDNLRGWNVARAVGVIPVRKDPGSLWVSICLRSAFIQHCIRTWATTTVQATFNLRDLAKLPIPIPPAETREAIAAVLGALDDKIELNRRMNATLEAMARALFQSWFIDFDPVRQNLDRHQNQPSPRPSPSGRGCREATGEGAAGIDFDPVRGKLDGRKPVGLDSATAALFPNSFRDSPIGPVPKGWKVERFDVHITADRGLSYKGDGLRDDRTGLPMHNLNSVYEGGGYKHEGLKYYAGEYREKHLVEPGDMIVTNTEQGFDHLLIGHAAIVPRCYGPKGLFSHHIYRVRHKPGSPFSPHYLVELFNNRRWHYWISGFSNGTTINMLPMDALEMPMLVVPPVELVKKFTSLADAAHTQVEANRIQSRTLATLRDTLLPKLLSGELSVAECQQEVSA